MVAIRITRKVLILILAVVISSIIVALYRQNQGSQIIDGTIRIDELYDCGAADNDKIMIVHNGGDDLELTQLELFINNFKIDLPESGSFTAGTTLIVPLKKIDVFKNTEYRVKLIYNYMGEQFLIIGNRVDGYIEGYPVPAQPCPTP